MGKRQEKKVLKALQEGPLKVGDLIVELGYDPVIDYWDRAIGIETRASFSGSAEQAALVDLIERNEVKYRRDRCQDVWYLLPGQRLPRVKGLSIPNFGTMCRRVYRHLSKALINRRPVGKDAVWHTFEICGDQLLKIHTEVSGSPHEHFCYEHPDFGVTLCLESNGFSLADGDPICNWCFNTFTKHYPGDVDPAVIARRIVKESKRLLREEHIEEEGLVKELALKGDG